jgi:N6-adenosine-specific RNA methylase IME4
MSQKYHTIYADPPWMERGAGKMCRGANRHYRLMKTNEIMALPIAELAEDNAHLYLWVTNNHLPAGLQVMKAWGFEYKTMITWGKDRIGIGQYFRGKSEHVLFGVRGMIPYRTDPETGKRMQGVTFFQAPRLEHSVKPEEMRQMIERVSPGPYLELFARRPAPGWDVWGDQIESTITIGAKEDNE